MQQQLRSKGWAGELLQFPAALFSLSFLEYLGVTTGCGSSSHAEAGEAWPGLARAGQKKRNQARPGRAW